MDTFFTYLKKALVGCIALVFAFIVTYTPQDYTREAHAGVPAFSLEVTKLIQLAQDTIIAASTLASSISTSLLEFKELYLDGIAWTALKGALEIMANSMIDWAGSGFRGGPTFVQDIEDFLRREADAVIGNYIDSLGEIGSFLCDPFKLDVRTALVNTEFVVRNTPASCTLSEVVDDIEDFTSGDQGSFTRGGGWGSWFEMTSSPGSNTYFGSLLTAQSQATELRLAKQSEEQTKLGWGNGFLSISSCNGEPGEAFRPECQISTPGVLIAQALNNNLDSNRQSLVVADEIDEAVTAFFSAAASGGIAALGRRVGGGGGTGSASFELDNERSRLESEAEALEASANAEAGIDPDDDRTIQEISEEESERVGEAFEAEAERFKNEINGVVNNAVRSALEDDETP